ncbi:MAG: hypothetical protein ACKOCM_09910, partial [Cyanobacteriota bacterium]
SWTPAGATAPAWLPSRNDLDNLAHPAAQVAGSDSGASRLRLDPGVDPSQSAIQRTLLQLSADALVSTDDLRLAPLTSSTGGITSFTAYQSEDLAAATAAERLASSRWLVVSSAASGATATQHTALYRPALQAGTANRIRGLGLPPTLINASGDRLLELTVQRQGSPDAILLRQRGNASTLAAVLADFSLTTGSAGPLELQVILQETLPTAAAGSVVPGGLRLFEQTLLFEVGAEAGAGASFSAPSANTSAAAGALAFQEGRGLVLLEDLSYAEALTALAAPAAGDGLRLQLQILGYSGGEGASYGSGLLSLRDLGLIPAASARDGGGAVLEAIHATTPADDPVQLQRISVPVGTGASRQLVNAWVLRPAADHQGPLALSLDYGDGRNQGSTTLPLTVINVPDAPRRVPRQESQLRLSLETGARANGTQVINLRSLAVDPDGTPLSFSLAEGSTLPVGISFNAAAAELSVGSLPFTTIGTHLVTVLASDGDPTTAIPLRFEITIRERNLAPVWNLPTALQAGANGSGRWNLPDEHWVLDANGDPLRYSLTSATATPLPIGIRLDGASLVVDPGTPAGTYSLRLGASDGPDRPFVEALTTLVVNAAPLVNLPSLRVGGDIVVEEGGSYTIALLLDSPASTDISLGWSLIPRDGTAEALLPSRSGLVRIAAGDDRTLLSLPTRNDNLLLRDQELELRLEALSGSVRLEHPSTTLMLLDNDSVPLLLTSRWLNDSELELLYRPGAAASAGTGLTLTLSDPSGGRLFDIASLSDVFLSGWVGETRQNGTLALRWSDPLAAAWPGTAAVRLARLRLGSNGGASSPAIRIDASAGEDQLVRWVDSPWQEPIRLPFLEELRAMLGDGAAGLQIEAAMSEALAIGADGELRILDARAVLERRYSSNPFLTLRRNGETIRRDLTALLPAEAGVAQLSSSEWALVPPDARDGSAQLLAS